MREAVVCIALLKFLPTTYLTIYRFGVFGNNEYKSAEKRGFPSGKGRKKLFYTESAVAGALTCRGSVVQVHLSSPVENLDTQMRIGASFF